MKNGKVHFIKDIFISLLAAFIAAININTFINDGNIVPSGFSGIALLITRLADKYSFFCPSYSVLYIALNIPYAVTILQGFMSGIPIDLEEAATIDGCSTPGLYTKIVMPLLKPGIVVVAIWTFLTCWNEFFLALCTMSKDVTRTLPLIAQQYKGVYFSAPGILFAILILITIPMIVFYIIVQKQFVKGLTSGAVKG